MCKWFYFADVGWQARTRCWLRKQALAGLGRCKCTNHYALVLLCARYGWLMQAWANAGATVSFAIQSERFLPALRALTSHWPSPPPCIVTCDMCNDSELDSAFQTISNVNTQLHAVLHSVAHAPRAALGSSLSSVTREDFSATLNVSVYSMIALASRCVPLLTEGGSVTALTFAGSQRVRALLCLF